MSTQYPPSQPGWSQPASPPPKKKRRIWLWVLLAIGGLLFAGCLAAVAGSGGDEDPPATVTSKDVGQSAASSDDLGTPVRDGNFEFVVQYFTCVTGKCTAKMTVENIGEEKTEWSASDQKLISDQGEGVEATPQAGPETRSLFPARKANVTLIWRTNRTFKADVLELHDSFLSNGVQVDIK